MDDVRLAIQETIAMDEEHGAFWVGGGDDGQYVLEASQDLMVVAYFGDDTELRKKFKDWHEIENVYQAFLEEKFDEVKAIMKDIHVTNA